MRFRYYKVSAGLLAAFIGAALGPSVRAEIAGRPYLEEALQQALHRELTPEENARLKEAVKQSAAEFQSVRDQFTRVIIEATGVSGQIAETLPPHLGDSRQDVDPRIFDALAAALNRPLNAKERKKVLRANAEHSKATRRVRRDYVDRIRKIVDLPHHRLDAILPEHIG